MPQETVNNGMHWEAGREKLDAGMGFSPDPPTPRADILQHPFSCGNETGNEKPDVDWPTWGERALRENDVFGEQWGIYTRLWWDEWPGRSFET